MNSPASAYDPVPTASSSSQGSPATHDVAFGLDTFGDTTVDRDGRPVHHAQVLRDVVGRGSWPARWAWTRSGSASTTDARHYCPKGSGC